MTSSRRIPSFDSRTRHFCFPKCSRPVRERSTKHGFRGEECHQSCAHPPRSKSDCREDSHLPQEEQPTTSAQCQVLGYCVCKDAQSNPTRSTTCPFSPRRELLALFPETIAGLALARNARSFSRTTFFFGSLVLPMALRVTAQWVTETSSEVAVPCDYWDFFSGNLPFKTLDTISSTSIIR